MAENTNIEWADHTWNPWRGCTKVSPGCANCYAEALSHRNPALFGEWGKGAPRVLAKNWNAPVKWDRSSLAAWDSERGKGLPFSHPARPRVFPSLCDWLDEEVPVEWLARFLAIIYDTPDLEWLLLTKRPENWEARSLAVAQHWNRRPEDAHLCRWITLWRRGIDVPDNVWFGVSVEDQIRAEERVPVLLKIPARLRWLSLEPLLGPVSFGFGTTLDWFVIGGESGRKSRPCEIGWVRSLVDQGRALSIPTFVKQLGSRPLFRRSPQCDEYLALAHPKGGDPAEWPADLRVRQFPNTKRTDRSAGSVA